MHPILRAICAQLKSPKSDLQMAAALLLAELRPRDPAVVKELCGCLTAGPQPLKLAALDALAQIAAPAAVPSLVPLLESADEEVRDRARRALVRIGPAAVRRIAKHVPDAPPAARRSLLAVLSKVRSKEATRALLDLLESGHPEACREAAQALVALGQGLGRPDQARLRSRLEGILELPPDKAPGGSLSAALHVLGVVGAPGEATAILKLTATRYPETVRRDALLALSGVLRGQQLPPRILSAILPIIQEGPSPALRSAALEVLGTLELHASALDSLVALIDHADPAVRRFAARKLGGKEIGGVKAARRLVPLLADPDPSLRDAAAESLGKLPEAAPLLLEELLRCDEVHRAWALAHILRGQVSRLRRPAVRTLFERAAAALTSEERIWEPLLHVVRHHDPKTMYDWLMEEAARLKKGRRYAEAEACLKPLTRGDHFDSEARYALALAGVKAARSRGSAAPTASGDCLDLFRQLVRDPAFPLVDRLKKERSHLQTEDLYYLGFHLAEGTPDEKAIGAELLKLVAARAGSSKLGRSARNKLRSEGLAL